MPALTTSVLHHGDNLDTTSQSGRDPRHHSRGRTLLAGGLTLVILAGCGSTSSPSTSQTSTPSPSTSQTEAQLTGTWAGTWAIDPPYAESVGDFTMELVQTGGSFSGTVEITNTDCSNGPVSGTVAGTTVTFGWLLTPQPVQLSGVLNGTSMSGTWAAIACSNADISLTGTWEATKQS